MALNLNSSKRLCLKLAFSAFYSSCIARNLVEQLWNFAWLSTIALIHLSLLPVVVTGFFTKFATIVGGPMVGKAMDHVPRVQANNFLNIAHASCLIRKLPSEIWFFLKKDLISSI